MNHQWLIYWPDKVLSYALGYVPSYVTAPGSGFNPLNRGPEIFFWFEEEAL